MLESGTRKVPASMWLYRSMVGVSKGWMTQLVAEDWQYASICIMERLVGVKANVA
ncbi:MAG: hypothetical protein NTAFB09_13630 [Nitrosospira sp.]